MTKSKQMKDQSPSIDKQLNELIKILEAQSLEIKQIKKSLSALVEQTKPKRMGAYLFPDCGYEWMFVQIKLSAEIWMRIKAGEHLKVAGNGWVPGKRESNQIQMTSCFVGIFGSSKAALVNP